MTDDFLGLTKYSYQEEIDIKMKITILGSGGGRCAPVYGCKCDACRLANIDSTRRRKPASVLIECNGVKLLIDAGIKDFHDRFPAGTLRYILLTEYQIDNVLGLYDVRSGIDVSIHVVGPSDSAGCADLLEFPGILDFKQKAHPLESFQLASFNITPLPLYAPHEVLGYLISCNDKCIAYLPDTAALDEPMIDNLREARLDVMFIDCNNRSPSIGHDKDTDIERALRMHNGTLTQKTVLTCLGHEMDNWLIKHEDTLPFDIEVAYEGKIFRL